MICEAVVELELLLRVLQGLRLVEAPTQWLALGALVVLAIGMSVSLAMKIVPSLAMDPEALMTTVESQRTVLE